MLIKSFIPVLSQCFVPRSPWHLRVLFQTFCTKTTLRNHFPNHLVLPSQISWLPGFHIRRLYVPWNDSASTRQPSLPPPSRTATCSGHQSQVGKSWKVKN